MYIHTYIENIISEYSEHSNKANITVDVNTVSYSLVSNDSNPSIYCDCYKQFSLSTAIPLTVQYQSESASNYNMQIIHYFVFLYVIH